MANTNKKYYDTVYKTATQSGANAVQARQAAAEAVQKTVLETGVWLRPFGSWLYAMPPFVTTSGELTRITDAMKQIASL